MDNHQIIELDAHRYATSRIDNRGVKGYGKSLSFHESLSHTYSINEGGNDMSDLVTSKEFDQFDKRITDKLNDIRIDTDKIKNIDKTTYEMKSDLSHIKVSTNTLEKDFSSMKSDVTIINSSTASIQQSIKDEFKTQKEELVAFRTEIKDEVISFKSTTMWSALGLCAAILIGAGGIIAAII